MLMDSADVLFIQRKTMAPRTLHYRRRRWFGRRESFHSHHLKPTAGKQKFTA